MKFMRYFSSIALVASGFFLIMSLAMTAIVFTIDEQAIGNLDAFSGAQLFVVKNMRMVAVGYVCFSALAFWSALGLRRSKRWAAWSWVCLLATLILWGLFAFALEMNSLLEVWGEGARVMQYVSSAIVMATALGGILLLSWLLRRLLKEVSRAAATKGAP
jgi:hypothetical protein